jgi:hypothetical protein
VTEQEIGQTQNTQIDFPKILSGKNNYKDIQFAVVNSITELKRNGITRIGFVSGPLRYANGNLSEEAISDEMAMREAIKELQERRKIPVFGSTSIFDVVAWGKLDEPSLSQEEKHLKTNEMFIKILEGGVTDVFMMEDWRSKEKGGCLAEFNRSNELRLNVEEL